jgi:hypothetical protein
VSTCGGGTTSRVMAADRSYGDFMIFTASVRNILDTPSYIQEQRNWKLAVQRTRVVDVKYKNYGLPVCDTV